VGPAVAFKPFFLHCDITDSNEPTPGWLIASLLKNNDNAGRNLPDYCPNEGVKPVICDQNAHGRDVEVRTLTRPLGVTTLLMVMALPVSLCRPAAAHPSYAVPQATLDFGDGRTATLEILYGDGIFFPDPARGQLRTKEGATIAKTPMGGRVTTFCPSVEYCWVFLNGLITEPWRLHPDQIAWDRPAEPNPYFPESDETPPIGFASDWTPWSFVLGVAILVIGNWMGLAAMLLPWLLIVLLTRGIRAADFRHREQAKWGKALSVLLWIALMAYELLAFFFMVMLRAFPLVMLLLVLGSAMFGLIKLLAWFTERRSRQAKPA
jgi:hypothetical protein